jgi:AraC-like DNA-binding protein
MKEHIFNIHDVVLLMTAAECILLAIFQTVLPAKNRASGVLLALFLLAVAVGSICALMLWNSDVHLFPLFDIRLLPYFLTTALLLKGPALLLYVQSITQRAFVLKRKHLLHLIPIIPCIILLACFNFTAVHMRYWVPEDYRLVSSVWFYLKAIPLGYVIASILAVRNYRTQLKNHYSTYSTTEPGWLTILTIGFLCNWTLTLLVLIISQFTDFQVSDLFGIADNYVTFILINALFTYSVVYAHKLLTTKPEIVKEKTDEKVTESAIQKVSVGMETQKLYLKHNLNIEEFSKRIDLPVKDVSAVINKHHGTNFFEFMNKYRVEEAKRLLSDPASADMTVLDILLQAGFNSKSAFHRFFNRLVGVSPSEFRKRSLNKTAE